MQSNVSVQYNFDKMYDKEAHVTTGWTIYIFQIWNTMEKNHATCLIKMLEKRIHYGFLWSN